MIPAPMQLETQFLPTQLDTQLESLESLEDEKAEEPIILKYWAKLVSVSKDVPPKNLEMSAPNDQGHQGLHTLGRSPTCSFQFNDRRISNTHCLMYCRPRFATRNHFDI
jgi:hypothetical protein